jgi:RimJ/RimL family protein N-acetyltransferase
MAERLHITTDRLTIRNLKPQDLEKFHEYRSNPVITKFQGFDVMTRSEAEEFIMRQCMKEYGNPGEWVQYGIEENIIRQLVGDCAIRLHEDDNDVAEIGITISHRHQKKGFAKEVMFGILKFLFDEKGIRRVVELTDAANTASVNLLKSCGFRQEGHFIENRMFKGELCSEYQFAMLKSEWDELRG